MNISEIDSRGEAEMKFKMIEKLEVGMTDGAL